MKDNKIKKYSSAFQIIHAAVCQSGTLTCLPATDFIFPEMLPICLFFFATTSVKRYRLGSVYLARYHPKQFMKQKITLKNSIYLTLPRTLSSTQKLPSTPTPSSHQKVDDSKVGKIGIQTSRAIHSFPQLVRDLNTRRHSIQNTSKRADDSSARVLHLYPFFFAL